VQQFEDLPVLSGEAGCWIGLKYCSNSLAQRWRPDVTKIYSLLSVVGLNRYSYQFTWISVQQFVQFFCTTRHGMILTDMQTYTGKNSIVFALRVMVEVTRYLPRM